MKKKMIAMNRSITKMTGDELIPAVYKDEEWRHFMDSSERSLKEARQNLVLVLKKIKYSQFNLEITGNFKI